MPWCVLSLVCYCYTNFQKLEKFISKFVTGDKIICMLYYQLANFARGSSISKNLKEEKQKEKKKGEKSTNASRDLWGSRTGEILGAALQTLLKV